MFSKTRLLLLVLLVAFACTPASANIYWYVDHGYAPQGNYFRVWAYYRAWVQDECLDWINVINYIEATIETNGPGAWLDSESGWGTYADILGDLQTDPGYYYRLFAGAWFEDADCGTFSYPGYADWEWHLLDGRPSLANADPLDGEPGTAGTIVANGDLLGFTPVSLYVVSGQESCGISIGDASSLGRYALSAPFEIPMADNGSTCKLRVTNSSGTSQEYVTFTTHLYAPEISLNPSSALRGSSGTLTVNGTHLYPGSEASTDCSGMSLGTVQRESNQRLLIPYSIDSGATPGACMVQVYNGFAWTTAANNFTITQ